MSPRSRDVIVGTGEKLVCRLFAAVLNSHGCPAINVFLDKCLDMHIPESLVDQQFYDHLRYRITQIVLHAAHGSGIVFLIPKHFTVKSVF